MSPATRLSVIIPTFGDPVWQSLAQERALVSVMGQTMAPVSVEMVHQETLHEARNLGAERALGDYLIFLDADDELDERYVEAMASAIAVSSTEWALFQPATLGVVDGVEDDEAVILPPKPIDRANYLIIGTVMHRSLFFEVGGFWDWPAFEDWCLFRRCLTVGGPVVQVPEAIYRVHVASGSRNDISGRQAGPLIRRVGEEYRRWKAGYDRRRAARQSMDG